MRAPSLTQRMYFDALFWSIMVSERISLPRNCIAYELEILNYEGLTIDFCEDNWQ